LSASAALFPWHLCATCLEQIRRQAQSVPGYLLIRKLGQGGMGTVYQALRSNGSVVALKTIAPASAGSRANIDRFLREASILAELHHRNIVAFHDMGEANGLLYFVMECVAGADAKALLTGKGPWPVERAVRLCCQVLEALEYAHELGYVHRDIKPANVLVTAEDGFEVAKLADFGLARVYLDSNLSGLTLQGQIGGTFGFIAPEQITNFREAKPAGDQYAAAATLYNLLTNHYIFDLPEQFQARIVMILQDEPVPIRSRRPDVPEELAAIIHRALAKEPAKRFRDVRALRWELMQLCY
jgi:serine/threonine-protein kinase